VLPFKTFLKLGCMLLRNDDLRLEKAEYIIRIRMLLNYINIKLGASV
jgi:hypothetical protein